MKNLEVCEMEAVAGGVQVVPFVGDPIWVGGGSGNGESAPGWQDLLPGAYPFPSQN